MTLISDRIKALTDIIIQKDWDGINADQERALRKKYQDRLNNGETHDVQF